MKKLLTLVILVIVCKLLLPPEIVQVILQVLLYLAAIITVWLLTGFLPGRALKAKRGRWYYIGIFNKIFGVVNGSKAFPYIPLPLFIRVIQIELTWTEYEKANETYQGGVQHYTNVEKAIGTKIEMTNLRHLEEHPIDVDVVLGDGYHAALVFDVTLTVFDPMKLVPRKGFLTYVQQEFSDVVSPWAHKKHNIESVLNIEIEQIQKVLKITHEGKKYDLWKFLNEVKFIPYGFCIKELSMKVGLPADSKEYFDIKNREKKEEARLAELKAIELRKVQERETFTNDATTEREVQEKDLEVTKSYQIEVINALADGQAKVAGSYNVDVLVLNGNDSSKGDTEKTKHITDSMTGALIAHKRLLYPSKDTTKKED